MTITWLGGLLRRRTGRLAATAVGISLAVALIAALGSFLTASKATMTARAVRSVAVDWQVQVQPGADPAAVLDTIARAAGVKASEPVSMAQSTGFTATAGGTAQSTGPGPRSDPDLPADLPRRDPPAQRVAHRGPAGPADRREPARPPR